MRKILRELAKRPYYRVRDIYGRDRNVKHQQLQRAIVNQYKQWSLEGINLYKAIHEAGFRCYSQFEEDGIILFILSMVGIRVPTIVEMCCGSGNESMAANLILNHGFSGVLFDGSRLNVRLARDFFAWKKDCLLNEPRIEHAWITKDNVNVLLQRSGASGDIDVFSLDMDGNDYWIWQAIEEINPRLCVFETHNAIPDGLRLTIRYQDDFNCWAKDAPSAYYRSVSLAAMTELSRKKGYRLIGGSRRGFNAFYLRNDVGQDLFPEVSIAEVHDNAATRAAQRDIWPMIKDLDWVSV